MKRDGEEKESMLKANAVKRTPGYENRHATLLREGRPGRREGGRRVGNKCSDEVTKIFSAMLSSVIEYKIAGVDTEDLSCVGIREERGLRSGGKGKTAEGDTKYVRVVVEDETLARAQVHAPGRRCALLRFLITHMHPVIFPKRLALSQPVQNPNCLHLPAITL